MSERESLSGGSRNGAGLDDQARRRLERWRVSHGMTQAKLAEAIGKNQAWMSRYLSREFAADLDTLEKAAGVFGHSVAALLDAATAPDEQKIIDAYRALPPESRDLVLPLLGAMSQKPRTRRRRGQ